MSDTACWWQPVALTPEPDAHAASPAAATVTPGTPGSGSPATTSRGANTPASRLSEYAPSAFVERRPIVNGAPEVAAGVTSRSTQVLPVTAPKAATSGP